MASPSSVVFVVDDDASLRRSLERLLRVSGYTVQTFPSAAAFLEQPEPDCPSCLLLDIRMPELTGLDLQQTVNQARPSLSVILMTGFADMESCILGMKAGAADFLLKPFDDEQLLQAVGTALVKSEEIRQLRSEYHELRQRFDLLTPRERQVFELVAEGLLNKQIAGRLGTREGTVKLHRANLIRKLQARSVSDLVRMADRLRQDAAQQPQVAQASA
ncbi:MAG: response regulator transcription factor [Gemmatimonadales bacterium]